jgi:tape measure domain-containing protein
MNTSEYRSYIEKQKELTAEIKKMGGEVEQAPSGWRSLAGAVRGFIALQVVGYIKDVAVALFNATAEYESLEMGMRAVMKTSKATSVEMEKLREVAKLPGLGYSEAVRMSISLQSAGMSADMARKAMLSFGNALATVGKGKADLQGVGLALSQIMSKGKVSAEEINQIAERVPQIRKAMEGAFGTANTEGIQAMGLSSRQFIAGITEELGKLEKVTGGLKNGAENLDDSWQMLKVNIGGMVKGPMQDFLTMVGNSLGIVNELLEKMKKKRSEADEKESAARKDAFKKKIAAQGEEASAEVKAFTAGLARTHIKLTAEKKTIEQTRKLKLDLMKFEDEGQADLQSRILNQVKKTSIDLIAAEKKRYEQDVKDAKNNATLLEGAKTLHLQRMAEIEKKFKKEKGPSNKADDSEVKEAEQRIKDAQKYAKELEKIARETQVLKLKAIRAGSSDAQAQSEVDRELEAIAISNKFQDEQLAANGNAEMLKAIQERYRLEVAAMNARFDADDEKRESEKAKAYAKAIEAQEKARRAGAAADFKANERREAEELKKFEDNLKARLGMHNSALTEMIRGKQSFSATMDKIEDDSKNYAIQKGLEWLEGWIATQVAAMVFSDGAKTVETAKAVAAGAAQTAAYAPAAAMASVASFGSAAVIGGAALAAVAATYFAMRETGGSTLGAGGLIVGEKRPEYFAPTTPGQIHNSVTNHNSGGNLTIHVSGGGDPKAIAAAVVRAQKIQARGRMGTSH